MDNSLPAIGERLRSQDNRATADPIFLVQKKVRNYGYDSEYSSDHIWILARDTEAGEITGRLAEALDQRDYDGDKDVPDTYTKVHYVDRWEFVTCCFTEQGCKDYLSLNAHNLPETRIYVDSAFRNNEFMAVRDFLKNQP